MSRERIMLTQAIPAVQQLRRVQGFDPLRFLKRNANGGIELEPRYQRLWFRLACPDGKMLLNRLQITDQIAVYEAQVFLSREDNQPITNFTAAVEKAQAPAGRYVQAAQDEALKTALDNAGFGIQLCEINPSAAVSGVLFSWIMRLKATITLVLRTLMEIRLVPNRKSRKIFHQSVSVS